MVVVNKEVCTGCGSCVADCISMSLSIKEGKAEYNGSCIHCGHCVAICPVNAVSIPDYDMAEVEPAAQSGLVPEEELLRLIKSRRSIRRYREKRIPREQLDMIINAGRYTATGSNLQACRFILVQDALDQLKSFVWDGVGQALRSGMKEAQPLKGLWDLREARGIDYLFRSAPAVLYIAAENQWDAGMAAQNMELVAVSQGLGGLYNGFLLRSTMLSEPAKDLLRLEGKPLATCMLLGYPDVHYPRTAPRKKADAVWL